MGRGDDWCLARYASLNTCATGSIIRMRLFGYDDLGELTEV